MSENYEYCFKCGTAHRIGLDEEPREYYDCGCSYSAIKTEEICPNQKTKYPRKTFSGHGLRKSQTGGVQKVANVHHLTRILALLKDKNYSYYTEICHETGMGVKLTSALQFLSNHNLIGVIQNKGRKMYCLKGNEEQVKNILMNLTTITQREYRNRKKDHTGRNHGFESHRDESSVEEGLSSLPTVGVGSTP